MTQLRTAWRRAVETAPTDIDLGEVLALFGPAGRDSEWTCDDIEALGPSTVELRHEASAGPMSGTRLSALAFGITHVSDGVFEATQPADDRPWLAVRVIGRNQFAVATRNRRLLEDLRRRFGN
jgi:hypothetical protein